MTTQNTAIQADDQALINDLFSEFDLDLDAPADELVLAAEPAAEEVELDVDLADIEATLAAEPAAEVAEPAAVEPAVEAAEPEGVQLTPVSEEDFDLSFDEEEAIAAEAAIIAATAAIEEEAAAAPAEPKAPKPRASSGGNRVTFYNSSKSTVLLDRLGGNKDMIILEASDLDLSKEELQAKRQYLLDVINHQPMTMNSKGDPVKSEGLDGQTVQKKVAEKVIQLFTYMSKGGNLNKVMRLAFTTLINEGQLTFGKQGTFQDVLLANGFSLGTARAQSGQIKQLFPLLKIVTVAGDTLKPNPESIILAKMNADLNPEQAA